MDNNLKCWNCGSPIETPLWGKLAFRAACEKCLADLHCCKNCVYYKPGLPNDCAVPGTEYIPDRTRANLCEEFKILGKTPTSKGDIRDAEKKLFGDTTTKEKQDPKDRFNSLF